jgi:2,3-bisphosphoglycerate-dependent phosphoglycerate mutase
MFDPESSDSPPKQSHYTIYFLRHGESIGNAEGFHQGQADFPLTERGLDQACLLASHWRDADTSFDLIISSPLVRAQQTAEVLRDALNVPLMLDPLWMERNNGLLAGLRPEEASQIYPRPEFVHPYQAIGETGESQWELYLRAGQAVQSLLNRSPGQYLVISHGGITQYGLLCHLRHRPHEFHRPRFRFGNTAFATLTYIPNEHKWVLSG